MRDYTGERRHICLNLSSDSPTGSRPHLFTDLSGVSKCVCVSDIAAVKQPLLSSGISLFSSVFLSLFHLLHIDTTVACDRSKVKRRCPQRCLSPFWRHSRFQKRNITSKPLYVRFCQGWGSEIFPSLLCFSFPVLAPLSRVRAESRASTRSAVPAPSQTSPHQ